MRVFVTGANGFIGSLIVSELLTAGHQVLGLTRSDAGAEFLERAGAEVHRGDIEDLDSLRSGVANADGVIHTAFNHDFSKFVQNCENDKKAIEAMGGALAGTQRPLIVTSGTAIVNAAPGQLALEDMPFDPAHANPRVASEIAADAMLRAGVNVSIVRLPQVHDPVKQGLVTYAIDLAREKGVSAYIGDGLNRWPAAHVTDVARLYRLALEKAEPGARYHAVDEEGVSTKDIAEAVGRGLNVPARSITAEDAMGHFGWLAMFVGIDLPASSAQTRERLGWQPTGPGMIADLDAMQYS